MKKALVLIAGVAGLLAAIPLVGGEKIVGGPFTVGVTQRTATMVWIVQSDEMTLRSENGTATLTSPSLRVERTTFTGLQPNTRYEYAIPDAGDAGTGSFKTPPPAGQPVPYRFVVYGDTRTRHDVHQRVIGKLMTHGIPDFILHTGDMVADGNDSALAHFLWNRKRSSSQNRVLSFARQPRTQHTLFPRTLPGWSAVLFV